MNILAILPLVFCPLEVDTLVWTVSEEWVISNEIESLEYWDLDAPNSGTYRLWGCATEPFTELTLNMRWRQDLNGSNNNNSQIFISESPPESFSESEFLPPGSLTFYAGTNGSDDPLEIYNLNFNVFQEIPPTLINYSEPFDLDIEFRYSVDSTYSSIRAGVHDSEWSLPVSNILLSNSNEVWKPKCIGFEATCTSSNTDAFSWGLKSLLPLWEGLQDHEILTHRAIDSTSIEIVWNRPSPVGLMVHPATSAVTLPGTAPHHSIFSGMGPLIEGKPINCRVFTNNMDTVLNVVWADSNSVNFREVTITELFVDATPSVGLPEVEWMEVLNRTDRTINLNGWGLISESSSVESGLIRRILPNNDWNGFLPPKARLLICSAPFTITEDVQELGYVAEVEGWSGLSDNGMTLSLLRPDGTLIDRLSYDRSWWKGESLAALSVSKIHPEGCGLASNWEPTSTPLGATPWERGELESNAPQIFIPISISSHLRNAHKVELFLYPDIDPISELQCRFMHEDNYEEAYWESPYWVLDRESPLSEGKPIDIIIEGGKLCSNGINTNGILIDWSPALPPKWGDLVISEFLTNPSPDSPWDEWVEIVNISNRILDLDGLHLGDGLLKSGQYLSVDSMLVLEPNCMDSWSPLSSNTGTLELHVRRSGLNDEFATIDIVEYSKCWHDDGEKADGGHSIERVSYYLPSNDPHNWSSGSGFMGASRGYPRPTGFDITEPRTLRDTILIWGSKDGRLCWHSPYAMDSCVLRAENWDPPIEWGFVNSSSKIAVSENNINDLGCIDGILEIACFAWKEIHKDAPLRTNSWKIDLPIETYQKDFLLNEFLSDPFSGKSQFVEVCNSSVNVKTTSGLLLTTDDNPLPNDWSEFTEIGWWIPPEGIIAYAECPSWVINTSEYSRIIKADLPSLTHGRTLKLISTVTGYTDEVEINKSIKGISKERYNLNEDIWVDAPSNEGGCSPGMDNFSSNIQNVNSLENRIQHPLIITPKTIDKNSISNFKWVILEWEPPENVGVWSITIDIFTSKGEWITSLTEEGEEVSSKKVWIFEGESRSEGELFPGTYIAVLKAISTGLSEESPAVKKILRHGLIQVN
jgi:hypothetical protein